MDWTTLRTAILSLLGVFTGGAGVVRVIQTVQSPKDRTIMDQKQQIESQDARIDGLVRDQKLDSEKIKSQGLEIQALQIRVTQCSDDAKNKMQEMATKHAQDIQAMTEQHQREIKELRDIVRQIMKNPDEKLVTKTRKKRAVEKEV